MSYVARHKILKKPFYWPLLESGRLVATLSSTSCARSLTLLFRHQNCQETLAERQPFRRVISIVLCDLHQGLRWIVETVVLYGSQ